VKKGSGIKAAGKGIKVVCRNPSAFRDYIIEDKLEAGIVLTGSEVKSLREGGSSLKDAYVSVESGEAWLINSHIAPYRSASVFNHEPRRRRKLLLHKKQIERLSGRLSCEGMTAVPLQMYFSEGKAKVELALAKGRKHDDKRELIRSREQRRELRGIAGNVKSGKI